MIVHFFTFLDNLSTAFVVGNGLQYLSPTGRSSVTMAIGNSYQRLNFVDNSQ